MSFQLLLSLLPVLLLFQSSLSCIVISSCTEGCLASDGHVLCCECIYPVFCLCEKNFWNCFYECNISYTDIVYSILHQFFYLGRWTEACFTPSTGCPSIALPLGVAHPLLGTTFLIQSQVHVSKSMHAWYIQMHVRELAK